MGGNAVILVFFLIFFPCVCAVVRRSQLSERHAKISKTSRISLPLCTSFNLFGPFWTSLDLFSPLLASFGLFSPLFTSFHLFSYLLISFHLFPSLFTSFCIFSSLFTLFSALSSTIGRTALRGILPVSVLRIHFPTLSSLWKTDLTITILPGLPIFNWFFDVESVSITTIWPTLLRVVNNRACLYKICLYYNWSKVLGTTTVVYLSSVEDRLRPLSFCLVPRELLSWFNYICSYWPLLLRNPLPMEFDP